MLSSQVILRNSRRLIHLTWHLVHALTPNARLIRIFENGIKCVVGEGGAISNFSSVRAEVYFSTIAPINHVSKYWHYHNTITIWRVIWEHKVTMWRGVCLLTSIYLLITSWVLPDTDLRENHIIPFPKYICLSSGTHLLTFAFWWDSNFKWYYFRWWNTSTLLSVSLIRCIFTISSNAAWPTHYAVTFKEGN